MSLGLDGPSSILVSGGVISTSHSNKAGAGSVLPLGSVALTSKKFSPSAKPVYSSPVTQELNAPSFNLHSNSDPSSVDSNSKIASVEEVRSRGPLVITVFGGIVSPTPKILIFVTFITLLSPNTLIAFCMTTLIASAGSSVPCITTMFSPPKVPSKMPSLASCPKAFTKSMGSSIPKSSACFVKPASIAP